MSLPMIVSDMKICDLGCKSAPTPFRSALQSYLFQPVGSFPIVIRRCTGGRVEMRATGLCI